MSNSWLATVFIRNISLKLTHIRDVIFSRSISEAFRSHLHSLHSYIFKSFRVLYFLPVRLVFVLARVLLNFHFPGPLSSRSAVTEYGARVQKEQDERPLSASVDMGVHVCI